MLYIPRDTTDDPDDEPRRLAECRHRYGSGPTWLDLLGWTSGKVAASGPIRNSNAARCRRWKMTVPNHRRRKHECDAIGWKVVKTDLDRPNATDINQFLVTTKDRYPATGYYSQPVESQHRLAVPRAGPQPARPGRRPPQAEVMVPKAPRPTRMIWPPVGLPKSSTPRPWF